MSEPEIKIISVPMLDTGIGIEAGYKDDAEFMAAMQAKRDAMPQWERELHERFDADLDRQILYGDGA